MNHIRNQNVKSVRNADNLHGMPNLVVAQTIRSSVKPAQKLLISPRANDTNPSKTASRSGTQITEEKDGERGNIRKEIIQEIDSL